MSSANPGFEPFRAGADRCLRTRPAGDAERLSIGCRVFSCVPDAQLLFRENAAELAIDDQRYVGAPLANRFSGELTPVQREAARALLAHDTGVFVGPPGIGKTVLARISSRSAVARRSSSFTASRCSSNGSRSSRSSWGSTRRRSVRSAGASARPMATSMSR